MQSAHHGSPRDTETFGRLGVAVPVDVDEADDVAVVIAECVQGVGDDGLELLVDDDLLRGRRRRSLPIEGAVLAFAQQGGPSSTVPVDVGAAQDGEEPRAGVLAVEPVDAPVGADQGVLDEVLRVGGLAGEGECHPIEDGQLGHDVLPERVVRLCLHGPPLLATRPRVSRIYRGFGAPHPERRRAGHYGGLVAPESSPPLPTLEPGARVTVEQHRADVVALLGALLPGRAGFARTETVPVADAAGRVLAADAHARVAVPAFRNSQMDGFAVRSDDVRGPVRLPVSGEIAAGSAPGPLPPGSAARIMTGAPLPAGADAVVPVEDTEVRRFHPGVRPTVVEFLDAVLAGRYVREAGSDVGAGDVVVRAGTLLRPSHVGALAACGARVEVVARPRVAVVSTGAEIVAAGAELAPGQVYDANGPALAAAAQAAGAVVVARVLCSDDADALRDVLDDVAGRADVIVTSGGVSQGAYEVVKDLLGAEGAVTFRSVAMQPGGPQGWGTYRGTPVMTFPGNPVSAQVSFVVFLRDVLRAAGGLDAVRRRRVRLAGAVTSPAGRRQFLRGRLGDDVQVVGGPGSHLVATMATADVLIDVPQDSTALGAGDEVEVWPL